MKSLDILFMTGTWHMKKSHIYRYKMDYISHIWKVIVLSTDSTLVENTWRVVYFDNVKY